MQDVSTLATLRIVLDLCRTYSHERESRDKQEIRRQNSLTITSAEANGLDEVDLMILGKEKRDSTEYNDAYDAVWRHLNMMLNTAANLSKLFWGAGRGTRNHVLLRKEIRTNLSVSQSSVLRSRLIRDHFEHFDERLLDHIQRHEDHVAEDPENAGIFFGGRFIFTQSVEQSYSGRIQMFGVWYSQQDEVCFQDDRVDMIDMSKEIEIIGSLAEAKIKALSSSLFNIL